MKSWTRMIFVLSAIAILWDSSSVFSQVVRTVSPRQNAINVSRKAKMEVVFDRPIDSLTASAANIRVWGTRSGLRNCMYTYDSGTYKVTIDPVFDFWAGEDVVVTVTNGLRTSLGVPITKFGWSFRIMVNPSSGTFSTPEGNYLVGDGDASIVSGDLDNDGDMDLAVVSFGTPTVSILLNNGDATFQPRKEYGVGILPIFVTSGDLNNDGYLDLVVVDYYEDDIAVLINNGDATFQQAVRYSVGKGPYSAIVCDLDGDGYLDIAVSDFLGNTVSILRNAGNGTFLPRTDFPSGVRPYSIAAADIDNDGKWDLIVTNYWQSTISVLKNRGDSTFDAPVSYPVGYNSTVIEPTDFNNDGYVDLAVQNRGGDTKLSILVNRGDGTFLSQITFDEGQSPFSMACADLNGDGYEDLVTSNSSNQYVSILKNNGNPTFQPRISDSTGFIVGDLAVADLNGDGAFDLILSNNYNSSIAIMKNKPLLVPQPPQLVGPVDMSAVSDTNVVFRWHGSSLAEKYRLQVSTDSLFYKLPVNDSTLTDTSRLVSNLQPSTRYYWRVSAKSASGWGDQSLVWRFTVTLTGIDILTSFPKDYFFEQNYPNPFNPTTTIRYGLPHASRVLLILFNTLGEKVATLIEGQQEAGSFEVTFDGSALASGVYFIRLQTGSFVNTKKLLLLR